MADARNTLFRNEGNTFGECWADNTATACYEWQTEGGGALALTYMILQAQLNFQVLMYQTAVSEAVDHLTLKDRMKTDLMRQLWMIEAHYANFLAYRLDGAFNLNYKCTDSNFPSDSRCVWKPATDHFP